MAEETIRRGPNDPRRDSGFSPVPCGRGAQSGRPGVVPAPGERFVRRKSRPRLRDFSYQGEYAYHVTLRTANTRRVFLDVGFAEKAVTVLHEAALTSQFVVLAYCFMPDHVHLLVQGQEEAADLKKFVALFKQRTGFMHTQQTGRPLWQASYLDRVLRRDDDLQAIADYVLQNPVKAGLAGDVGAYPLSGGAYFEALRLDRRTFQVRNPEARRDRAEAAVPTNDGAAVGTWIRTNSSRKET